MNIFEQLHVSSANRINSLYKKWQVFADKQSYQNVDRNFGCATGLERKLNITYVMNHVRVCGGAKIIFEHTNQLVKRGHKVSIVCHYSKPDWIEVMADYIQVPWQVSLVQAAPDPDIIVCTVSDQVIECYLAQKAPVLLFEQGDVYIYDFAKLSVAIQENIRTRWKVPVPIMAVSSGLGKVLLQNFDRNPQILHNSLDSRFFFSRLDSKTNLRPRIMFVGAEQTKFKGIGDILAALEIVKSTGRDFESVWVSPVPPETSFDGTLVINPSQSELGQIYRSCDIYVSGSYYESFPLPPLEAMTSGCAVVSTENVGIAEYGIDGENCIFGSIGDPQSLADAIIRLLDDSILRTSLVQNGYKTASKFTWTEIIPQLERYLCQIVDNWSSEISLMHSTLRVETLPLGLSQAKVVAKINDIQVSMTEQWCLYLIEGEALNQSQLQQIMRITAKPISNRYALQMVYEQDVPDHPLVRPEVRLLRKGERFDTETNVEEIISIRISAAQETYFLPSWLASVRRMYLRQEFADMVAFIQKGFGQLGISDQATSIKWLVLGLLELSNFAEAQQVMSDAINIHPLYSDLWYLYARTTQILGNQTLSKQLADVAILVGDALTFRDAFINMAKLCNTYMPEQDK